MFSQFKNAVRLQRDHFSESGSDIALRNLTLMRICSCIFILIYALFFVVTAAFFREMLLAPVYFAFVPLLLIFFLYATNELAKEEPDAGAAFRAALLFYVCLALNAVALSVFPHPDRPSVWFPLFLMFAPVMMVLKIAAQVAVNTASYALFVALALAFKKPEVLGHELFEATVALIFSFFVIALIMQFKMQSDSLKSKYYRMSRHDPLTGLLNKGSFLAAAHDHLQNKPHSECFSIMIMDVDDFKAVNDTYGHLEGDELLIFISRLLQSVFPPDAMIARFGGDEFIVLHKNRTPASAEAAVDALLKRIAEPREKIKARITCSAGICYYSGGKADLLACLDEADKALYRAKGSGKNRFVTVIH